MVNAACPAEFNDAHWPSFAGGEEGRGSVGGESFTLSSGLRLGPGWFPRSQILLEGSSVWERQGGGF